MELATRTSPHRRLTNATLRPSPDGYGNTGCDARIPPGPQPADADAEAFNGALKKYGESPGRGARRIEVLERSEYPCGLNHTEHPPSFLFGADWQYGANQMKTI
ncbi:hypothetical protein ACFB49_40540 [Sphingomonas sp. DBB INV C78]